jgi:hypothetical protein
MTLTELRSFTRFLTNTNTTTYSDADLDFNLNSQYDIFTAIIINSMDDWDFQADYATTNLVAGQQEYTLPTDIIKIKRVEVSYDGTNWYEANPMDINERTSANDATSVASDFSTASPMYDLMDSSLFLYPIPSANSTGGLKIWYEKNVTPLSSTSDIPVIIKSFHKGLCYGAAEDFFDKYPTKGDANKMQVKKEGIIELMKETYRKHNQDRPYVMTPTYVDYGYDD